MGFPLSAAGINAPKPIIVSIQTCNVDTERLSAESLKGNINILWLSVLWLHLLSFSFC